MASGDGHLNRKRRYTARAVIWFWAYGKGGEVVQPYQGKAREYDAALGLKSLIATAAKRHRKTWPELYAEQKQVRDEG